MELEELLLRRLAGHRLLKAAERLSTARALCGVQAQFMSNAMHALRIRCTDWAAGGAGLVKNWSLRGTVHVFPESDLPLYIRAGDYRKTSGTPRTGGTPVPTGRFLRSGSGIFRRPSWRRWKMARARARSSASSAGRRA